MSLLPPDHVEKLREMLLDLNHDVTLVLYTQKEGAATGLPCPNGADTETLMTEFAALSDRLSLETHDFADEGEKAAAAGIDKIPAIIVRGALSGERVRYFGLPAGYEFASFVEDVIDVGRGTVDLSPESRAGLAALDTDVRIQVFASPTCPYCPGAVRLAHRFAMASERVVADCVVAADFPDAAEKYAVMAVPKTVVNETLSFEGALKEEEVLQKVVAAASGEGS